MQVNLPVTQQEQVLPDGVTLVSTTDAKGRITHCNQDFVFASGFDYAELLNQPHSIVRHPDMPPEAFKDLWSTIGRGRPWSGVVKNRCKNGDHYWVLAHVTPILRRGKPAGYMSVRVKPTREQIAAAEALYAQIVEQRQAPRFHLHAGKVRQHGWRDWLQRRHRLSLGQRAALALLPLLLLPWAPALLVGLLPDGVSLALQALGALFGLGFFMHWFARSVARPLQQADAHATQMAGCRLDGEPDYDSTSPLGHLLRRLALVNLNVRAIVTDVRAEAGGMDQAITGLHQGSEDLAARTDSQAASLEQTASALEQISGTALQTSATVQALSEQSESASQQAQRGGETVDAVAQAMSSIEDSSRHMADIIQVIEQLAFQTNLLALNAAVEAAHAGEQGRGFAVVAAEVRALAHRSAEAARQIRDLIQASASQVQQGHQAVVQASGTIAMAAQSAHAVRLRLGDIVQATKEQSQGMEQINDAVHLLDQVTQENARLVKDSHEASDALRVRSETLTRAVAIFSMGAEG